MYHFSVFFSTKTMSIIKVNFGHCVEKYGPGTFLSGSTRCGSVLYVLKLTLAIALVHLQCPAYIFSKSFHKLFFLKPPVTSIMRSNVVYQITCPRCKACYVGATTRHLRCRFSEHKSRKGCSVKQHINKCNVSLCEKDVTILGYNNREDHLFTLEAILQFEIRPKINGKEEFETKIVFIIF